VICLGRYVVGITGASGSIYGVRLIEELIKRDNEVCLVITDNGKKVLEYEVEINFEKWYENINKSKGMLRIYAIDNMFASLASGSFKTDGMIIVPCSMGTLSKISAGTSDNLLTRAADVTIKEKRKLILIPRESPLSSIHLKNMLYLSNLNVTILLPMPTFYNKPKTIEDIINDTIGRILASLGVDNDLYNQWGENN